MKQSTFVNLDSLKNLVQINIERLSGIGIMKE